MTKRNNSGGDANASEKKQSKLTGFFKAKAKEDEGEGEIKRKRKLTLTVSVSVNVVSLLSAQTTQTDQFVSAVVETDNVNAACSSSGGSSVAHVRTSSVDVDADASESSTQASSVTLNLNVTLNVGGDNQLDLNLNPIDITPAAGVGRRVKAMQKQELSLPPGFQFPVTNKRKFNPKFLEQYVWLEYSISRDATFCYACRSFTPTHARDNVFKYTGFSNWKTAAEANKGFKGHNTSAMHLSAMGKWTEALQRDNINASVAEMASGGVLHFRRNYMKKVIEVIIFMIQNELPFRGTYDIEASMESGLFKKLFAFTRANNPELVKWESHMPHHYTYLSPDIQNEIIALLASMVREAVAAEIMNADVPHFSLLEDGTKDKRNEECISLGARYVVNGRPVESIISMETFAELNAEYMANQTLQVLEQNGISHTRLLW